tara:strand:- start:3390 stop:3821 length:432 start_codon:yes stop_codon:yes gene_type:complete
MNVRQHAFHARALQDACGGPDRCLELLQNTPFRMSRTRLYATRDPGNPFTMPIGAVAFLEAQQNWRLYTLTLARQHPEPTETECAISEACEATEAMSMAQRLVRLHAPDGFTEHEKREIEPHLQMVERHIAGVRAGMDAGAAA